MGIGGDDGTGGLTDARARARARTRARTGRRRVGGRDGRQSAGEASQGTAGRIGDGARDAHQGAASGVGGRHRVLGAGGDGAPGGIGANDGGAGNAGTGHTSQGTDGRFQRDHVGLVLGGEGGQVGGRRGRRQRRLDDGVEVACDATGRGSTLHSCTERDADTRRYVERDELVDGRGEFGRIGPREPAVRDDGRASATRPT